MTKKLGLIAAMALAALAFAIPVSAASAEWTHDGNPLSSDATVEFSGTAGWVIAGTNTGTHATVHIEATLKKGTTDAVINTFEDTNCTGTGDLAGLTCTATAVGLPWSAHIDGDDIVIEEVELDTHYYSPFDPEHLEPVTTSTLEAELAASPDNPEAISDVTLEEVEATVNGSLGAEVGGTLSVSPEGTYGTT